FSRAIRRSGTNDFWLVISERAVTQRKHPHAGQTESPGGLDTLTIDDLPQISQRTGKPSSVDVDGAIVCVRTLDITGDGS
ncbi:MAG: hypothetical protein KDA83_22455, partial [Planctomycetales bacterium]|nr:hypothetical protein [Planctomycetales bacterium]